MADSRPLSISEPLCFAIGRYGKLDEKSLKQVLYDFFTNDQLFVAKNRLSEDIASLQLENWQPPGQHRGSEKQASMEIDDIYRMTTFLDERLLLDKVPVYVCENIDRIPGVRWMDGDFQLIVNKLNKMQEENTKLYDIVDHLLQRINAQGEGIHELRKQSELQLETNNAKMNQFGNDLMKEFERCSMASADRCVNELAYKLAHTQDIHFPPLGSTSASACASAYTAPRPSVQPAQVVINNVLDDNGMQCDRPIQACETTQHTVQQQNSQLSSASFIPPVQHQQQNNVPTSAWTGNFSSHMQRVTTSMPPQQQQQQQQQQQRGTERHTYWGDQPQLTASEIRQFRRSHRGQGSYNRPSSFRSNYLSSTAAESDDDGGEFQEYHSRQHRRQAKRQRAEEKPPNEQQPRLKVVGKANTSTTGLRAHGNIVDKRVFSVSNVDESYTEENINGFLHGNGIRVVTVHNAKSKFNGKCFRVCIVAADTELFMNPDIWPENVIVRPWFFKEKQDD